MRHELLPRGPPSGSDGEEHVVSSEPRDVERIYSTSEVVAKLRRLADALEKDAPFRIQIAGERIHGPARAEFSIEHERGSDEEEVEFQLKWKTENVGPAPAEEEPVV